MKDFIASRSLEKPIPNHTQARSTESDHKVMKDEGCQAGEPAKEIEESIPRARPKRKAALRIHKCEDDSDLPPCKRGHRKQW